MDTKTYVKPFKFSGTGTLNISDRNLHSISYFKEEIPKYQSKVEISCLFIKIS